MNVKFKRFLVCFCIMCTLSLYIRSEVAYCVTGIEETLAIGASLECASGGTLTPIVVGALVAGAIGYAGYTLYDTYKYDVESYILNTIGVSALKTMVNIANDDSGQEYATLSNDGVNAVQSACKTYKSSSSVPVSTSQTTSNTINTTSQPYMANGFYMQPYLYTNPNSELVVVSPFLVKYGDVLNYQFKVSSSSSYISGSFTPTRDCYIKILSNAGKYYFRYSYNPSDLMSYVDIRVLSVATNTYNAFGYYTTSNTVYVPSDKALTGTGIDGNASDKIASGATVAVPISAQYGTSSATYGIADGATATAVSGLTAKTGTQEGTTTGELTEEGIRDAVKEGTREGISDSAIGDLSIPSTDVPTLDFSPLMVATQKFPFCVPWDLMNVIKSMSATPKCPVYTFPQTYVGEGISIPSFSVDVSTVPNIDTLLNITKFFELAYFLWFLIIVTRNLIRG